MLKCSLSQLGVRAVTVEDLVQAQKEITAHNLQLREQTKQLERDMVELRDQSLVLVSDPESGMQDELGTRNEICCVWVCQLRARCEELKLDWGSLCLEKLLKEKAALRRQISEKQRHCLELQVLQMHSSINV